MFLFVLFVEHSHVIVNCRSSRMFLKYLLPSQLRNQEIRVFRLANNIVLEMHYSPLVYRMKSIKNKSVRQAYGLGEKKEMIWPKSAPEFRIELEAPQSSPLHPWCLASTHPNRADLHWLPTPVPDDEKETVASQTSSV